MKKYFVLTFDLPLFGPSGINNRPSPLLLADINSCQGTHTNAPSGQNIYYPLTQKSFYPVHLSLDISLQWLLVFFSERNLARLTHLLVLLDSVPLLGKRL